MKKFVFSMESVPGLREWEEQLSRQAFNEISTEMMLLEEKIRNMKNEAATLYERWSDSHGETFTRADRLFLMGGVDSMQRIEGEAKASLEDAGKRREKALVKMTEAVRNKKVVENLKQRRLEEYRVELIRHEALEIEDAFNARRKERAYS